MQYRLFGRSGLRVSELCLGGMTFGDQWGWGADAAESKSIFETFADAGGNFIDTADIYTEGASEKLLGEFIAADRDHFVVASKYTLSSATDAIKSGNSRKNMRRCVEESLRRLKTDHIDLYWLHFWDGTTPIDELMRGFDDLVSSGKVTYIAVSDAPAWQISRANMLADLRGWTPFVGIQVAYSLLERTAERDLLPMARELDLGITAWSPLAGGVLSGKYHGDPVATSSRGGQKITPHQAEVAGLVVEIAAEIDRTPGQVALAAIRRQRKFGGIIPILGARTSEQLIDNLGCLDIELDDAVWSRLDEATAPTLGFPHDFLATPRMRAQAVGPEGSLDDHRAWRHRDR